MRVRGLVSLAAGAVLACALTACGSSPAGSAGGPAPAQKASRTPVQHPAADSFKSVRKYATVAAPTT